MPDLDAFTAIAEAQFDALPEEVRSLAGGIQIRIAQWPEPDALRAVGLDHPLQLLGLFEGIGLGRDGWSHQSGTFPNRIWLYRMPILNFTADGDDPLPDVIRHVLVHEIGHHFGLSDDDMEAIDNAPEEPAV
ncbi:MAG: metallopeptidase family protein [Pseudomonadota bacterium]